MNRKKNNESLSWDLKVPAIPCYVVGELGPLMVFIPKAFGTRNTFETVKRSKQSKDSTPYDLVLH